MSTSTFSGSIFSLTNHEMYVVTASHQDSENGQIATWIMPATLVPDKPRIVAILSPQNYTHSLIQASRRFVLNLLAEDQYDLVPLFGLVSGKDIDKFDSMDLKRTSSGIPIIPDTCGWAECVILAESDSGDRRVYIADVVGQEVFPGKQPLHKNEAFAKLSPEIRKLLENKHIMDGERDSQLIRRFF